MKYMAQNSTWAPGIIGVAVGIAFLFYKLDRESYYQVLEQLKARDE